MDNDLKTKNMFLMNNFFEWFVRPTLILKVVRILFYIFLLRKTIDFSKSEGIISKSYRKFWKDKGKLKRLN